MNKYKYYYRISKYDPTLRENGVYIRNEWTSYSDIGQEYNGVIVKKKDYLLIEERYLKCLDKVLQLLSEQSLTIIYLEKYHRCYWHLGQSLSKKKLHSFLKDCLREKCWGKLENCKMMFEVGYDFYLHLSCNIEYHILEKITTSEHLFLEEWNSFEDTR